MNRFRTGDKNICPVIWALHQRTSEMIWVMHWKKQQIFINGLFTQNMYFYGERTKKLQLFKQSHCGWTIWINLNYLALRNTSWINETERLKWITNYSFQSRCKLCLNKTSDDISRIFFPCFRRAYSERNRVNLTYEVKDFVFQSKNKQHSNSSHAVLGEAG